MLLIAMGTGCKKDKASPSGGGGGGGGTPPGGTAMVQFTLDGDGFSNQAFTINPGAGSGILAYSVPDDRSSGHCMADAQHMFNIVFPGQATGPINYDGDMSTDASFTISIDEVLYMSYEGTITIDEYGAVGGWVRGTFNGTVIRMGTFDTYATVSAGSFHMKRIADVG